MVFLHVLLYFARKPMIYYGFCRCWQETYGFALVLPGFDSGAAGRLVGCPKIPIMPSKDFQNIGILGFVCILKVLIGICQSGFVFIGTLVLFHTFC